MQWLKQYAVLSNAQMYEADERTMAAGIKGADLMERAGRAVADAICDRRQPGRLLVMCGIGNNGGDGFVIGRLMRERGWEVRVALRGEITDVSGDAVWAAGKWMDEVEALTPEAIQDVDCIVDSILGAGLSRPIEGDLTDLLERASRAGAYRVAVDIPSGVSGDSGAVLGTAFKADLTVTFYRKKRGHLLAPGRFLCGELVCADIGIPGHLLDDIAPSTFENDPNLWRDDLATPDPMAHKYERGHLLVLGGGLGRSGAARLAARAGLRAGAGLVTTGCPPDGLAEYAAQQTSVMNVALKDSKALAAFIEARRVRAVVVGPGNGVDKPTKNMALAAVAAPAGVVLDADALSVFAGAPQDLFEAIAKGQGEAVLTPHAGEFRRLFPDLDIEADRIGAAREAAGRVGAVVVLKGADTVIAAPGEKVLVNIHASPHLATAGSGDVLAGIIGGVLASGTGAIEAAAAATWLLGETALGLGAGLISEDLVESLPQALAALNAWPPFQEPEPAILL